MTSIAGNRVARRRAIAFASLLGVSLLLMIASSTGPATEVQRGVAYAFRPLQSGLDGVAQGISGLVTTVTEIDRLHRSNEALAQENAKLAAENTRTAELERQNALLSELLKVKGSLAFSTVAGSVIGRESSQFRRVVTLDVGADDGVKEGDVVVGPGRALAGRVVAVEPGASTVLLVSDTGSTVIGQLGDNQATGSVSGQLGGVLVMEDIDSTERLKIGDTVTTAGIDLGGGVRSPFPKGILIGTVVDVQRDANAVTQSAFVQPTVDLDRLEYALVITNYQGGLPPVEQQPVPCSSAGTLPEGEQPCVNRTPKP